MQDRPCGGQGWSAYPETSYRRHSLIRALAVAVTAAAIVFAFVVAMNIVEQPYSGAILKGNKIVRVASLSPVSKAGLRKGDTIVSINGVSCANVASISDCLARLRPGEMTTFGVLRDGKPLLFDVRLERLPQAELIRKISMVIVGLSFVAIGLVVYFRRSDKLALVFYLLCLSFGLVLTNAASFQLTPAHSLLRSILSDLLQLMLPALFLHFFLLFPLRSRMLERFPPLEPLIYAPSAILFGASTLLTIGMYRGIRIAPQSLSGIQVTTATYFALALGAGLVAFVRGYRRVENHKFKQKLKGVFWGTLAGVTPLLVTQIILNIRPSLEIPGEKFIFLPLILVPLAFGHAIVRYGLLDLEVVFRRSIIYTLLVAVLASIYFIVVYGIGRLASSFIGSADLLFSVISIFVITLLISPLRSRIRLAVDKTFFRDEYNYRKLVKQISHSLVGMVNLEGLVSYICIRVAEAIDATSVAMYLHDERLGVYAATYAVRMKHEMLKSFADDSPLVRYLKSTKGIFNIERHIASRRPLPVPTTQLACLMESNTALIVPFIFKSRLLGFMTVGGKADEEFYGGTEIELLETLSDQVSVAIENTRLYVEAIEKQKIDNELMVAKEIQRRFMPRAFPKVHGIETAAMNFPSKHIGGDYYDIIVLSPTRICAVIADVSGKGVPAALLMASLQSALRAEADAMRSPCDVVSHLNRTIFEHTDGATFVTLFYGLIDLERAKLTYCNAGHVPPLILSKDKAVKVLDETDIVLGVDGEATYRDTDVELREGDLLFLYTDGITEELNTYDQPFGEGRLIQELKQAYELKPETILANIHAAVMRHTMGKPQDDLTALVIRLEALVPSHLGHNPRKS